MLYWKTCLLFHLKWIHATDRVVALEGEREGAKERLGMEMDFLGGKTRTIM
jgi:hypothetical protein